jgi:hypothetical protein
MIDPRLCHLGFFPWFLPTKPCALRSTQPLKMSTRDFSWGKDGRCVWLTRRSGATTYPEPLGPPRPVAGHLFKTNQLRGHFLVEELRVSQLLKKFTSFYGPGGSLACSQQLATCPYSESYHPSQSLPNSSFKDSF